MPPTSSVPVSFQVHTTTPGIYELSINATSENTTKTSTLTLVRYDQPRIDIKKIALPETVAYGDSFDLSFTLSRGSIAPPQNTTVLITGSGIHAQLEIGELHADQEASFSIKSTQLWTAKPTFDITITHTDQFGKQYEVTAQATTNVQGLPWYKRLIGLPLTLLRIV